jgi:hypothetical protein
MAGDVVERPILDTYQDIDVAIRHLRPHVADRKQLWRLLVAHFTVDLDILAIAIGRA